ncbi:Alpha/beta hydrolase family protein [compost metagenome]
MYKNDMIWKEIQNYLPCQNRLDDTTMPKEFFLELSDGNRIHLDVYSPKSAKATIILFHGVGGNGRLLSFLAVPLYRCGYEVICPDLPLYGYSECSGTITYDTWVADASEITDYYVRIGKPTFVFGLSAGGMLAYQVACEIPSIRGVLATCILDQRLREITEKTSSNPHLIKLGLPVLAYLSKLLPNIKIPMKWVANMRAIVNHDSLAKLLMSDQKSSGAKISLAFLHTMLHPKISIEPSDFRIPFSLLHPENDRWTDVSLSRIFYDKLGGEKEISMLNGAGHFPIEEEGLNALIRNSIQFIEKHR